MTVLNRALLSSSAISPFMESVNMAAFRTFLLRFHEWIHSSRQPVRGLHINRLIVSGVTDALNQTYGLYTRVGVFEGEYGYHHAVLKSRVTYNLETADVIVISHPFSGDGMSSHERLAKADKLNKPIFVDCAFFGICANQDFDFTKYKNIRSVCFSLSKAFGTGLHRVGLLYTLDPYPAGVYSDWFYPLVSSAEYHYKLLDTKGPDDTYDRFKDQQHAICARLRLVPSDTVIFGIDTENRFGDEFKRGYSNRICITRMFDHA